MTLVRDASIQIHSLFSIILIRENNPTKFKVTWYHVRWINPHVLVSRIWPDLIRSHPNLTNTPDFSSKWKFKLLFFCLWTNYLEHFGVPFICQFHIHRIPNQGKVLCKVELESTWKRHCCSLGLKEMVYSTGVLVQLVVCLVFDSTGRCILRRFNTAILVKAA